MNDLKGIIEDCNKSDIVSDKVIKKIIEIIGQEEWQDLHDEYSDICTTTGEVIITLKGIAELEKENKELNDKVNNLAKVAEVRLANWQKYEKENKEAKDLIRNLLRVTYGEGWNYSLDVKVKAEQFLGVKNE